MPKNFVEKLKKIDFATYFVLALATSAVIYVFVSLFSQNYDFKDVFYGSTKDSFMDFFNSVRDAHLGLGAYTERHVIYPPMANLIYYLFSLITPREYNVTDWDTRLTWSDYTTNKILIAVFLTLCAIALTAAIFRAIRGSFAKKAVLTLCFCASVPHIFLVERGNIISLALCAVLVFFFTYDSESKVWREIGLIALAFSFSIKLYTVLFAWILIGDKRFREFFRCALYSLALLVLPSFAFGPQSLIVLIQNIFGFSTGTSSVPERISVYVLEHYDVLLPASVISTIMFSCFAICAVNFLVTPFVYREKWQIWKNGCLMFISFPALVGVYNWLFFVIPLILLFNDNTCGKGKKFAYFILMSIPFLYIPISLGEIPITANTIVVYTLVFVLGAFSAIDTLTSVIKKKPSPARL